MNNLELIKDFNANMANAVIEFSRADPEAPRSWTGKQQLAYQALVHYFGIDAGEADQNGIIPGDTEIAKGLKMEDVDEGREKRLRELAQLAQDPDANPGTREMHRLGNVIQRLGEYFEANNENRLGEEAMVLEAEADENVYGAPELVAAEEALRNYGTIGEYEAASSRLVNGDPDPGDPNDQPDNPFEEAP